jgi:alanine racemase
MSTGRLAIDLAAIVANWRALQARAGVEAAAVVKADAYGLGLAPVARALAQAGARKFFVAYAEEGHGLRRALGPGPDIMVLSGHMAGDARLLAEAQLVPMLNSVDQLMRHLEALPDQPSASSSTPA